MPLEIDWTDADEIGAQPQEASPSSIQSRLRGAARLQCLAVT
jgi:hypothetical protein